jgi:hypothetical protein
MVQRSKREGGDGAVLRASCAAMQVFKIGALQSMDKGRAFVTVIAFYPRAASPRAPEKLLAPVKLGG